MGWNSEDQFSFGDYSEYGDIQLYALARLVKHPVSQDFSVELSDEFIAFLRQVRYIFMAEILMGQELVHEVYSIYFFILILGE
jgi:hypothetical protein